MKKSSCIYCVSILFLLCATVEGRGQVTVPAKSTIEKTNGRADRITGREIDRQQIGIHQQNAVTAPACPTGSPKPRRHSARKPR